MKVTKTSCFFALRKKIMVVSSTRPENRRPDSRTHQNKQNIRSWKKNRWWWRLPQKKKKCFFLVTCIVHTYILVGWWFVLSNGGLSKNRNETKLISQNSIFVLYHMTTRRCCHNIVQSSFLPAFASWSRFSISLMMVWKISCTLCGKERNIRAQFKRMKG